METSTEIEAEPGIVGTAVQNGGGELLLIPEAELRKVDEIGREMRADEAPTCEHCRQPFTPRTGGGKVQKYCSQTCRNAHRERGNSAQSNSRTRGELVAQPHDDDKDWKAAFLALVATGKQQTAEQDADRFDWSDRTDQVFAGQPATAIYENRFDQIVIRQESRTYGEDDPYIVVDRANVRAVIDRLCDVAGIGKGGAR